MNKKKDGLLVSVEGIDSAGKTVQLSFIANLFREKRLDVLITREPGGTNVGESIRHILLDKKNKEINKDTELLLFFAARVQHYHQLIKPALNEGKVVVCDRFIDSSYAYQGGGRGIAEKRIEALQHWALNDVQADITLLFDLEQMRDLTRCTRAKRSGIEHPAPGLDRFEQEQLSFFTAVRECYLERARSDPERIKIIDANNDIKVVQKQIKTVLEGSKWL